MRTKEATATPQSEIERLKALSTSGPEEGRTMPGGVLLTRFWHFVTKSDGCWLWTGATVGYGYGRLGVIGRNGRRSTLYAHRFSYELHNGRIPAGLHVCHHCDTPGCVNPTHLFVGTVQDNVDDMKQKGRSATGDANGMRKHPEARSYGERQGAAKLTWALVRELRAEFAHGGISHHGQLADRFGISRRTVGNVINIETWKPEHDPQNREAPRT